MSEFSSPPDIRAILEKKRFDYREAQPFPRMAVEEVISAISEPLDELHRIIGRLRGLAYGLAGAMAKEAVLISHQQEGEDAWAELKTAEFGAGLAPPSAAQEDTADA